MISEISRTAPVYGNPSTNPFVLAVVATLATSATFQINNFKVYVFVVTLSIKS